MGDHRAVPARPQSPRAPPSRQLCRGWTRGAAGGRDQRATGRGRCCGPEASPEPERRGQHGGVGKGHGGRPAPGPPALRTCRCPETSRDHLASLGSTGTQAADFLQRKPPGLRKDTILQTEKQPNAEVCRPAQGQRHLCAQRNRSWQRPLLGAGWRCPEPGRAAPRWPVEPWRPLPVSHVCHSSYAASLAEVPRWVFAALQVPVSLLPREPASLLADGVLWVLLVSRL